MPIKTFTLISAAVFCALAIASAEISVDENLETRGFYGLYPLSREASGTSWQPETTPLPGTIRKYNQLSIHYRGFINGGYITQTGDRGENGGFTNGMFAILAQHPVEDGLLGVRLRLSPDPLNGDDGYPLLLQNGGTGDGQTRLIDRQYSQELIDEIALTFSTPVSEASSVFFYAAYPGQPALGPPDYVTRFSGADNPASPLTRKWLDSPMVSYGVLTAGYTNDYAKFDASVFNATQPDQSHWGLNYGEPKLKSYSGRVALALSPMLVWDFSAGHLAEPDKEFEELVDINRLNSFLSWNLIGEGVIMQNSFGWGRNMKHPGIKTDAFLLESALKFKDRQTYFGRFERAEMDGLFPVSDPRSRTAYTVYKAQIGYIHDFPLYGPSIWGIGGSVAVNFLPQSLKSEYGESTPLEFLIFMRVRL